MYLVLGPNGMLGKEVVREIPSIPMYGDITQEFEIPANVQGVINCAAYTKVDLAELEVKKCFNVNTVAPYVIYRKCVARRIPFVFISTDYVFDGNKKTPYVPTDITNPLNVYGKSKEIGESLCKTALIIRTSWLFGHSNCFPHTLMTRYAEGQTEFSIIDNEWGCPTYTVDLARRIKELLQEQATGIHHVCNSGPTSWYEFAKNIIGAKINPISTINRQAVRPKYSTLQCNNLPHHLDALQRFKSESVCRKSS